LARPRRGEALYSLNHVIDLEWMKEAYRLTRKDGAPGIDGVTAATYEVNLEGNSPGRQPVQLTRMSAIRCAGSAVKV
jgi:hypothetical protein